MFLYEKWPVFIDLMELRTIASQLSRTYKGRGFGDDLNQFMRGASSGVLNLGEGARKPKKGHKLEHYGIVLGSVSECNAALIVLSIELPNEPLIDRGRLLCERAAQAMTHLIKVVERDWE